MRKSRRLPFFASLCSLQTIKARQSAHEQQVGASLRAQKQQFRVCARSSFAAAPTDHRPPASEPGALCRPIRRYSNRAKFSYHLFSSLPFSPLIHSLLWSPSTKTQELLSQATSFHLMWAPKIHAETPNTTKANFSDGCRSKSRPMNTTVNLLMAPFRRLLIGRLMDPSSIHPPIHRADLPSPMTLETRNIPSFKGPQRKTQNAKPVNRPTQQPLHHPPLFSLHFLQPPIDCA